MTDQDVTRRRLRDYVSRNGRLLDQLCPDIQSKSAFLSRVAQIADGAVPYDQTDVSLIAKTLVVYLATDLLSIMEDGAEPAP